MREIFIDEWISQRIIWCGIDWIKNDKDLWYYGSRLIKAKLNPVIELFFLKKISRLYQHVSSKMASSISSKYVFEQNVFQTT